MERKLGRGVGIISKVHYLASKFKIAAQAGRQEIAQNLAQPQPKRTKQTIRILAGVAVGNPKLQFSSANMSVWSEVVLVLSVHNRVSCFVF